MDGFTVVVGLIMVIGFIGIVVPLLPGLLLIWAAVLLWATETQTAAGWAVLGVSTILALVGILFQYLLPGRRMAKAGVPTASTLAGAVLGMIGFFVVPVVGLFLGFVLGIYLAERSRLGTQTAALSSTKHAVKAIALSVGIELLTGLAIAGTWVVGVITSA